MSSTAASDQLWANNFKVFPSPPLQFANSTAGYVPLALDFYDQSTTGNNTAATLSAGSWVSAFQIIRLGKLVIVTILSATGVGAQVNNTKPAFPAGSIPARFAPSVARIVSLPCYAGAPTEPVEALIGTDGSVTFQFTGGANLNSGGAAPISCDAGACFSYQL